MRLEVVTCDIEYTVYTPIQLYLHSSNVLQLVALSSHTRLALHELHPACGVQHRLLQTALTARGHAELYYGDLPGGLAKHSQINCRLP